MTKPFAEKSHEVLDYVDTTKPVHVYMNLPKKVFSVRQDGIVRCHAASVYLENAEFVVSEKGRQRVLAEKRKNVHAYVKGMVTHGKLIDREMPLDFGWNSCYYDPYTTEKFTDEHGKHVKSAKYVDFFIGEPLLVFSQLYYESR